MTQKELKVFIKELEKRNETGKASDLQFERAAQARDQIFEYKTRLI